jgi:hypothetical protein
MQVALVFGEMRLHEALGTDLGGRHVSIMRLSFVYYVRNGSRHSFNGARTNICRAFDGLSRSLGGVFTTSLTIPLTPHFQSLITAVPPR